MSEYQYYEFAAIDRPLTEKEMSELRSRSSRARITPARFVNDYSWGSFKGDEKAWMEKYFDGFLYFANWGVRIFMLRLPSRLLGLETVREYCYSESASAYENEDNVILSFVSEGEPEDLVGEDEGRLSSMIPVRSELARGDPRALYLGWLLCVQNGDLDDEEVEPPAPPGLGHLSASLERMAEFLRIDTDLIQVAAQCSPSLKDSTPKREDVQAWVAALPANEKDRRLTSLIVDEDRGVAAELYRKFLEEYSGASNNASPPRRTAGELRRAAEALTDERLRIEDENRAREKAHRERDAAILRQRYLDSLAGREPELWARIEALIAIKQPKFYDQAIRLLGDLRDLDARGQIGDFQARIEALRETHSRKPSFIGRLNDAGF